MSAEFSRRSFLKYTALTAVAVAGSSLLTGCSETSPVQQAVGTTNTVMQVQCTLDSAVYDASARTVTFKLTVYNGRGVAFIAGSPLNITRANFKVTGPADYCAYRNEKIEISSPDSYDPQIAPKGKATFIVTAKELTLSSSDAVQFTFYPDVPEYPEYNANWVLTTQAMESAQDTASAS